MPKPVLLECEKRMKALMEASDGLLKPDRVNLEGRFIFGLECVRDRRITVNYAHFAKRCLQVSYWVCGDRKINGKWKATEYVKTRSFKNPKSVFKFINSLL